MFTRADMCTRPGATGKRGLNNTLPFHQPARAGHSPPDARVPANAAGGGAALFKFLPSNITWVQTKITCRLKTESKVNNFKT